MPAPRIAGGKAACNPTIRKISEKGRYCGWGLRPQAPGRYAERGYRPIAPVDVCAASATRKLFSVSSHRNEKQLLSVLTDIKASLRGLRGMGQSPMREALGEMGRAPVAQRANFTGNFLVMRTRPL